VFNYEGGCYAKVIGLSATAEPEIYACTRRFGTILENVVFDPVTRMLDLEDDRLTENTRASYPLDFIGNAVLAKRAGHPKNIVMLTCDASGVMPPIARLTPEQALYHFISGYTAKVSATEMDRTRSRRFTFSTCFGAPFMVHKPSFYADILKRKILPVRREVLVAQTPAGSAARTESASASASSTPRAAQRRPRRTAQRREVPQGHGLRVRRTRHLPRRPREGARAIQLLENKASYDDRYRSLASRFIENFKKYSEGCPKEVLDAGPRR